MTDIKSIRQQSVQSAQTAPAENTQKTSEITKESRPAEFRPLSKEQQANLKQTKFAESKFAESAIKNFIGPWPKATSAETHVAKHEMEDYYQKHPAADHLAHHATEAYYAEHPAEDHVSRHIGEALGKGDFSKAGNAKNSEYTKPGSAKEWKPLPMGTGPTGDTSSLPKFNSDLPIGTGPTGGMNAANESSETPLKAKKFFPDIQHSIPVNPEVDDFNIREEEWITAESPAKSKAPDKQEQDLDRTGSKKEEE